MKQTQVDDVDVGGETGVGCKNGGEQKASKERNEGINQ